MTNDKFSLPLHCLPLRLHRALTPGLHAPSSRLRDFRYLLNCPFHGGMTIETAPFACA